MIIENSVWRQNAQKLKVGDLIVFQEAPLTARSFIRLVVFVRNFSEESLFVQFLCFEKKSSCYFSSCKYTRPYNHSCMSYVVRQEE